MEPLKYLSHKRKDIIYSAISSNYNELEAENIYQKILENITVLKNHRESTEHTKEVLKALEDKRMNNTSSMNIIQHWLLMAIQHDYSFVHAYNNLAYFAELSGSFNNYEQKEVDENRLYEILKAEESLNEISTPLSKAVDHSDLLFELKEYIDGISDVELSKIIEKRPLTSGTPKAKWNGIPADAARFADHLGMRFADFNKLFDLKGVKKLLPNHRQKVRESGESTTSEINTILEKFIPK